MSNVPLRVLEKLVTVNHGWWFDYIDSVNGKSRLRKKPFHSAGFLALYGFDREEISINSMVEKSDQKRVVDGLRAAISGKPVSERFRMRTKSGATKLIEVYTRRIELEDGTAILASLHSDLAVSNDLQAINSVVLDKLRAFVFVKRWNPNRERFEFTYINKNLAESLGLESQEEALGKADADYFSDKHQINSFLRSDLIVFKSTDDNLISVNEEVYLPSKRESTKQYKRLMTFKTPYESPTDNKRERRVLGISLDVTDVTDLLRAVAETSAEGIFIKDPNLRYVMVNQKFQDVLGLPREKSIIGKTFEEAVQGQDSTFGGNQELLELVEALKEEDADVLAGSRVEKVRTDARTKEEYLTVKINVPAGERRIPHILGMTSRLFWGKFSEILNKVPQCFVVKRYDPSNAGKPGELVLVWGNRRYIARHHLQSLQNLRGKTDYDIWPVKRQADRFREADLEVIRICQELELMDGWTSLDEDTRSLRMIEALNKHRYWEYREEVESESGTQVFQTTKWAEKINNTWFVIVIYSDVTEAESTQEKFHRMTVHGFRGALVPVGIAISYLDDLAKTNFKETPVVENARKCLYDVNKDVNWILEHHLRLAKMNVRALPFAVTDLWSLIESELDKLPSSFSYPLRTELSRLPPSLNYRSVLIDDVFFRAIISEGLRNAANSIKCRKNMHDNLIKKTYSIKAALREFVIFDPLRHDYYPSVRVSMRDKGGYAQLVIADNGMGSLSMKAWRDLQNKLAGVLSGRETREQSHFGLSFVSLALARQNCGLDYELVKYGRHSQSEESVSQHIESEVEMIISIPFEGKGRNDG